MQVLQLPQALSQLELFGSRRQILSSQLCRNCSHVCRNPLWHTHTQAFSSGTYKSFPGWCLDVEHRCETPWMPDSPQAACTMSIYWRNQRPAPVFSTSNCALCKRPFLTHHLLLTQHLHATECPCT